MFSRWKTNVKPNSSKQVIGKEGEDAACKYLQKEGFHIQERNFRTRFGEIDIVAKRGGEYYFIEVKTRTQGGFGESIESLPPYRVARFQKMVVAYASRHKLMEKALHLSLLGIDQNAKNSGITFIKDIVGVV
ncbi:MAG: YraN family protein [Deltaproteobacteria bacterium]|nr:YraN family protein [Deltaproteobacteria bacterium]